MSENPTDDRPRLSGDVEIRYSKRGVVMAAPSARDYCEIPAKAVPWLEALDGQQNLDELVQSFGPGIARLVEELRSDGYLDDSPAPSIHKGAALTRQGLEFSGAANVVSAVYPLFRGFFRPIGLVLLLALGSLGLLAPLLGWLDLETSFTGSPLTTALALLGATLVVAVAHELGHALVLAHYGRAIGRVGVGLYWGGLCFYVDASAAIMLTKKARMWQAAAGVIGEAALAGVLVLSALFVPAGSVRQLLMQTAAVAVIGVLVNATPLLRLDGYWLVTDALDVPDLYQFAADIIMDPKSQRKSKLLVIAYILTSAAFGALLLAAAVVMWKELFGALFLQLWLAGWVETAVAALLVLPLAVLILQPFVNLMLTVFAAVRRSPVADDALKSSKT